MATGSTTRKHERVILSIEDKTDVIDMLDHGSSLTAIAAKYSSAKSTVSDIKKNKEKILALKRKMAKMGMSLKAKIVQLGDNYDSFYTPLSCSVADFQSNECITSLYSASLCTQHAN